jgi:hypothetical protein
MTPTVRLIERSLDAETQTRIGNAARQAGFTLGNDGIPPAVIIAGLAKGERTLPSELHQDVDPATTVILLCQETLVKQTVLLAGGRLVLVPTECPVDVLAGHLRGTTERPLPKPKGREVLRERRWAAIRLGTSGVLTTSRGALLGVVAAASAHERAHELQSIADAIADGSAAERLLPPIIARSEPWAATVFLNGDKGPWQLGWHGACPSPMIAATLRMPSSWKPTAMPGVSVRTLNAHRGDVVLITGPMPDDPAFFDTALGAVALLGGVALADHLESHSGRLGVSVDAIIAETLA